MITATKQFSFCLAHMLEGHLGLCKNLHGHNYELHATITRPQYKQSLRTEGPAKDMVMDFKELKEIINELVCDKFDHGFVWNVASKNPVENQLGNLLMNNGYKVIRVNYRPTAEKMVQDWIHEINNELYKRGLEEQVCRLRLYETPTSYAEVTI